MNKNDLILSLAEEFELTKTSSREIVDHLIGQITDAINNGEEAAIAGFGKFKLVERAARRGRNPVTGDSIKIAARKTVKFEPAKAMKEMVNAKKRGRGGKKKAA